MNCKRPVHFLVSFAVLTTVLTVVPIAANAYNFIYFGGRQGRPGVTDQLYSWDRGASGGQISWFFQRGDLAVADASDVQIAAMEALIQPELNKWSTSLDLSFVKAANAAAADVVIEFEATFDETGAAVPISEKGDGAATIYGKTMGATLLTAEVSLQPSKHWANDLNDFSFVMLHEWGHVLGLGDMYAHDYGGAVGMTEGEDFIDHGYDVNSDPLNTHGKGDNVMNTNGVMQLDNDDLAGAQWLWGALGEDSIVTGDLKARAGAENTTENVAHHGPNTWVYRGTSSVASAEGAGTVVTLFAQGVTAARFDATLGGGWTSQILKDRVIFSSQAGFAGNFEFELDSLYPEGYINARIVDNTPTDFTVHPSANGPQFGNSPQVFGPVAAPEPATLGLLGIVAFSVGLRRIRH